MKALDGSVAENKTKTMTNLRLLSMLDDGGVFYIPKHRVTLTELYNFVTGRMLSEVE